MIVDDYIYSLDITDAVNAVTPAAQYTAWCNALGVSATVPVQNLDGDDSAWILSLGSNPTPDGIAKATYSTEGIWSYYTSEPDATNENTAWRYSTLEVPPGNTVGGTRRGYTSFPGKLAFAFSHVPLSQDSATQTSMFQRAGNVTLLKGRVYTNGTTTNIVDFAIRQEGTTTIIVLRPASITSYLAVYTGRIVAERLTTSVTCASNVNRAITIVASPTASNRPTFKARGFIGSAELVPVVPLSDYARTKTTLSSRRAGPHPIDGISSMLGLGRGRINGTVKSTPDIPVHRMVRLIREVDGMLVAQQWSDATTGSYSFDYIDEGYTYTVISYDYLKNFSAVVADNVTPDLIELP